MLHLNLFGTASVEASGLPVTGRATQGRRLALLALLTCARGRAVTRDKLIALLWPDSSTERARRQLSDDVYIVRSTLGDDVLRSLDDELVLNPATVTTDVETFERLFDEGSMQRAVELFIGPLLDGFHLSDGGEFERWLDAERARLAQRYAAALESLAEASEARGEFAIAAAWWRKLAAHDPHNGRVTLRLMRALEAAGDRAGALRQARVHATLLRDDFDADPDPALTALAARLREPTPRAEPVALPAAVALATVDPPAATAAPADTAQGPTLHTRPIAPRESAPAKRRHWQRAAGVALLLVVIAASVRAVDTLRGVPASPGVVRAAAPSVGVLPFVNMSADSNNTYFSDGLSEQIISSLSHINGLKVAARTSSFALRDKRLDVRAIGDTLGVTAVLEGSVRTDGRRLRIAAQLIDAATGYHLWSEDYDREVKDVFAVQAEIAGAIALSLELRLAPGDEPTARPPFVDLQAYDLYLRGLYMRNALTPDALRQAVSYFDRAIALEPGFALAYAGKASVLAPRILFDQMPREEGLAEVRALTARALELDSTLGEAHVMLGIQKLFFDWDWQAAEQSLRRGIALNPNDAHAWHHLANYLRVTGRLDEAAAARERAVELDPLNARTIIALANDYMAADNLERAAFYYQRAFTLDPVHPLTLGSGPWFPATIANVYLKQGRFDAAVEELSRIATLRGASASEVKGLRDAFARFGMPGFWRSWMAMDRRQSAPDSYRLAELSALSGDTLGTVEWLERAYRERNPALIFLRVDPPLMPFHARPRVARIIAAMKYPSQPSSRRE